MDIKGTQTEQNLLSAFAGESIARNNYLFYAEQADKEGHTHVAKLFRKMAQNEGIHGKLLLQKLHGINDTSTNLQNAMKGEYSEWSHMYPSFAETARKEGLDEIADLFENIGKIEQNHEFEFMQAMVEVTKANQAAAKNAKQAEQPQMPKTPEHIPQTVTVDGYRCIFCGATFEHPEDVCSVCQAIGSFEPVKYQKTI